LTANADGTLATDPLLDTGSPSVVMAAAGSVTVAVTNPPPRTVEVSEPQPLPATAVQEPVASPPEVRPRPPQPATQQRPDTARPEPPRVEPAAPAEPTKPVEDVRGQPPATLQTTPVEREAQVERTILDTLSRASTSLNRVDYRGLNADARTQYDQALRFITQAREALRDRNLVFAGNLADKAQTIAVQLAGR